MTKVMLKMSKVAYVIGLLRICKNWVKGLTLNPILTYLQSASWPLDLTKF